jgi:hypothetical protein
MKPWRKHSQQLTARQVAHYWSNQFNATMPLFGRRPQDHEKVEEVEVEVLVHVEEINFVNSIVFSVVSRVTLQSSDFFS